MSLVNPTDQLVNWSLTHVTRAVFWQKLFETHFLFILPGTNKLYKGKKETYLIPVPRETAWSVTEALNDEDALDCTNPTVVTSTMNPFQYII